MRLKLFAFALLCSLSLSGCAEVELASHVTKKAFPTTTSASKVYFKVGNPYKIAGLTYTPQERYEFVETGVASWYGPNFHGKKTANGETFDMYDMTAAHKTLQMPSIIRVTNLENGRNAIFRVNDRGPFSKNRVLDVSKKGAEILGFQNQGTTNVRIEVLSQESLNVAQLAKQGHATRGYEIALNNGRAPAVSTQPNLALANADQQVQRRLITQPRAIAPVVERYEIASINTMPVNAVAESMKKIYVQAAAFKDSNAAQAMAHALSDFGVAKIVPAQVNGQPLYRVRLGPVKDETHANMLVSQLGQAGRYGAIVVVD